MQWLPPAQDGETDVFGFILPRLANCSSCMDVGCGDGKFTKKLKRWRPDILTCAVDAYKPALHTVDADVHLAIDLRDQKQLRLLPRHVDAVICMDVLEHLKLDEAERLIRTLKEISNTIVIFTPYGFMENHVEHDAAESPWQEHHCGIEPEWLEALGFETFGWENFDYGNNVSHPALWGVWRRK